VGVGVYTGVGVGAVPRCPFESASAWPGAVGSFIAEVPADVAPVDRAIGAFLSGSLPEAFEESDEHEHQAVSARRQIFEVPGYFLTK